MVGYGDLVYDPFLGSGTTMIACEQLGRRCYGLEIAPIYIDVAVQRYVNHTGSSEGVYCKRGGESIPYETLFKARR